MTQPRLYVVRFLEPDIVWYKELFRTSVACVRLSMYNHEYWVCENLFFLSVYL